MISAFEHGDTYFDFGECVASSDNSSEVLAVCRALKHSTYFTSLKSVDFNLGSRVLTFFYVFCL
jgi:hypothetical protein